MKREFSTIQRAPSDSQADKWPIKVLEDLSQCLKGKVGTALLAGDTAVTETHRFPAHMGLKLEGKQMEIRTAQFAEK